MSAAVHITSKFSLSEPAVKRATHRLHSVAEKFAEHRAHVGILEEDGGQAKKTAKGKSTGLTLAEVAAIHEFNGRSWLRTWFDQNLERFKKEMPEAMRAEYEGNKDAVKDLAHRWSVELRAWIEKQEGGLKALEDFTILEKQKEGLSHPEVPLLATGQLVESVKAMLDGSLA